MIGNTNTDNFSSLGVIPKPIQGLTSPAHGIQQIADAVAAAMGVDVTVADDNLLRVAGTGPFEKDLGKKVPQGCVFERALNRVETVIVEKPREGSLCIDCHGRDRCQETLSICTPITIQGKGVGILAIVAFTPEQRDRIYPSLPSYIAFLEKMAELIATKITEHSLMLALEGRNRELEAVVNHIHQGVICVDSSRLIRQINTRAVELLKLQANVPEPGDDLRAIWPDCLLLRCMENRESYINASETYRTPGGKQVRFLSSAKALILADKVIGGVLTFSDLESTHKDAFRAIEHGTAFTFNDIIGTSHAITQVKQQALTAAKYDSNILLTGETGTGKELFARAIHNASPRRDYPFVAVNCTAIPESLLESELFGYEAGAFTGASKNGKPGKFELANHGTLFLDEIGDMPLFLQAKLLRAIQNMEITRVGGLYPKRIDARIISATNQDLEELMRTHRFRDDLYYRLCVVPINLPPLRQRPDDIPVLADYFIARYAHQFNKAVHGLTDNALDLLMAYDWPGNARELENVIEYAVNFATDEWITVEKLRDRIPSCSSGKPGFGSTKDLRTAVRSFQKQLVKEAIERHGENPAARELAAQELGISRATLY
ncbi:MAG: sigma 54-interacting transcriptional regulator, partial [Firmicutes bacterium]|nr:sigma 54-interacting transcriptional regulator [Bacillota bacterium]